MTVTIPETINSNYRSVISRLEDSNIANSIDASQILQIIR